MGRGGSWRLGALALAALVASGAALADPAPAPPTQIAKIELAKAFGARSPWRLVATQGPPTEDYGGDPAPGAIQFCLQKGAGPCAMDLTPPLTASGPGWDPHYLTLAKPVYPKGAGAPPLLMLVTASLHAGDGGQLVATQLFSYDRAGDRFERVFARSVGTNNNEEVRFVTSGPLAGDIVSAEPTQNAPYGYWIEVDALTPTVGYKQVLRYRSATHYGDGNRLAVIDSELPNTLQRLGKWKPGEPLPLPAGACPKPHLVQGELWCE
jgi:hypothetical protein